MAPSQGAGWYRFALTQRCADFVLSFGSACVLASGLLVGTSAALPFPRKPPIVAEVDLTAPIARTPLITPEAAAALRPPGVPAPPLVGRLPDIHTPLARAIITQVAQAVREQPVRPDPGHEDAFVARPEPVASTPRFSAPPEPPTSALDGDAPRPLPAVVEARPGADPVVDEPALVTERKPAAPVTAERKPAAPMAAERKPAAPVVAERKPAAPVVAERKPAAPVTAERKPAAPVTAERKPAAPVAAERKPAAPLVADRKRPAAAKPVKPVIAERGSEPDAVAAPSTLAIEPAPGEVSETAPPPPAAAEPPPQEPAAAHPVTIVGHITMPSRPGHSSDDVVYIIDLASWQSHRGYTDGRGNFAFSGLQAGADYCIVAWHHDRQLHDVHYNGDRRQNKVAMTRYSWHQRLQPTHGGTFSLSLDEMNSDPQYRSDLMPAPHGGALVGAPHHTWRRAELTPIISQGPG